MIRPFEICVPSVNDHLAIVDTFRKFHENGPCIQTISFRVTLLLSYIKLSQKKKQKKTTKKPPKKQSNNKKRFGNSLSALFSALFLKKIIL